MRGKSEKTDFSTKKSQWGGGRGKQTKRWRPPALLLSIHKQHKPALAGELHNSTCSPLAAAHPKLAAAKGEQDIPAHRILTRSHEEEYDGKA